MKLLCTDCKAIKKETKEETKKENKSLRNIEILAPAGDMEALTAALTFGADAVYLAGEAFGMRAGAKNFKENELKAALKSAREKDRKIYVACNTLPRNDDFAALPDYLAFLQEIGVDAVIVADLGVLSLAKKYAPKIPVHISTQAGVVNYAAANALYELGASRVVLARELTLEEISQISAKTPKELEIECFVHGAMCVSFSGRCIISNYLTGRDANRGDCAQPCRWKYHLYEEHRPGELFEISQETEGAYLYNSRDLCMIEHIPELIGAGVQSLKIEGRAKSAYYSAVTAKAYKGALEEYLGHGEHAENSADPPKDNEAQAKKWYVGELEKISHREYSTGFFFGHEPGQATGNGGYIRKYDVVAVCEASNGLTAEITQRNKFYKNDILDVLPPVGLPFLVKAEKLMDEKGEEVESSPHPMQRLWLTSDKEIPPGSYLRRIRI